MEILKLLPLLFLAIFMPAARGGNTLLAEHKAVRDAFGDVANRVVRPAGESNPDIKFFETPANVSGNPTLVSVSMHVLDVHDVDVENQEFKVTMYLRQSWNDPRYVRTSTDPDLEYVTLHEPDPKMWVPDLFFVNERKGRAHDVTTRNSFVRIHNNGDVLYSSRYTVTLACPMELNRFPFDSHICSMSLESYGYLMTDLVILWSENKTLTIGNIKPKPFALKGYGFGYCNSKMSKGEYSCLQVQMLMRRIGTSRYVMQGYVPLGVLLTLSFSLLWCGGDRCKKMMLGICIFVVISFVAAFVTGLAPASAHVSALECWASSCLVLALIPLVFFFWGYAREWMVKKCSARNHYATADAEDPNKTVELLPTKSAENTENGSEQQQRAPTPPVSSNNARGGRPRFIMGNAAFERSFKIFCLGVFVIYIAAHVIVFNLFYMTFEDLTTEKKFSYM